MFEITLSVIIGIYVIGILLIVVEMFIPGGILGTFGLAAMITAIVFGFQHSMPLGATLLVAGVILVPSFIVTAMKYAPNMPFTGKIFLKESLDADKGYSSSEDGLKDLVGKKGEAITNLRPSGMVNIDGERIDVVTGGEMVEKGTGIEVLEVEGNRVVVQAVES